MRRVLLCALFLFSLEKNSFLWAEGEIEAVEQLIEATSKRLEVEEHLRDLLIALRDYRGDFAKGNQTRMSASRLVSTAQRVLEIIEKERLKYLFPIEYMDEITFFASIAGKHAPNRP